MKNKFKELEKNSQAINRNDFQKKMKERKNNNLNELVKNEKYLNGLNIFIDQGQFEASIIEWLSNVAASDLISTKNIDIFVGDLSLNLDEAKTQEFDELLKKNYLEMMIYSLCKNVSLSGIAGIWFMPNVEPKMNNKFSLNSNINIIQLKQVNNETQAVSFLVNLVNGIAIGNVYAMVYANKERYITRYYAVPENANPNWKKEDEISKYEYSEDEIIANLDSLDNFCDFLPLLNKNHDLGFVPFKPLFFNQNYEPLIKIGLLRQDLDELYAIATKLYDEANMMGTKVKWVNDGEINSASSKNELMTMIKVLGSLGGIFTQGDFNSEVNRNDVDLITKNSIYIDLMNAFKSKLNFILKKIGLSSDTDSKGTVQQSIGEIIKQNQYSYNLQNYRNLVLQNYLQEFLSDFFYANQDNYYNARTSYKVKVLSTQSLGMSEMEKLNYVIMAKSNGLIDQARGISILTGKNYIEAKQLAKLQNLKENPEQPTKIANTSFGVQHD